MTTSQCRPEPTAVDAERDHPPSFPLHDQRLGAGSGMRGASMPTATRRRSGPLRRRTTSRNRVGASAAGIQPDSTWSPLGDST